MLLLSDLYLAGIQLSAVHLLRDYFTGRAQFTRLGGKTSSLLTTDTGVL